MTRCKHPAEGWREAITGDIRCIDCGETIISTKNPSAIWRGVRQLFTELNDRLARAEGGLLELGLLDCQFCHDWQVKKGKKLIWSDDNGDGVCVECLGRWYESMEDESADDFDRMRYRFFNIVATLPKSRRETRPLKDICKYHQADYDAAIQRKLGR